MAKRFGKRGSTGMQGQWEASPGVFCYLPGAACSILDTGILCFKKIAKQQGWGGKRESPYFLPLVSPASKSVLCSPTKCVCVHACTGGGRLAQPNLKILSKNANPKAKKERRRNLSINGLPLLTHSCTNCIPVDEGKKWGNRAEEKKGTHATTSTSAGREAAEEEGLGRQSRTKRGLHLEPEAPRVGVGWGASSEAPPSARRRLAILEVWKPKRRTEAWSLSLGKSEEGFVWGPSTHSPSPTGAHTHAHALPLHPGPR